jgi:oligopeptide/dipeptide ABC transporter ATP-binding protein
VNETILKIENLVVDYSTRYGNARAINNVSFEIYKREIFGLVGESGSGKTTMGLAILNLLASTAKFKKGKILFKGRDLTRLSDREINRDIRGKEISMVIQNPQNALNPVFKVGEQIMDVLKYNTKKILRKELKKKAIEILKEMGIADTEYRIDEYPHQFSGGMKQRVMMAMAFISNPSLLIADEPTTALDVTVEAQILKLIKGLVEKYQTSVLYITHDLSVVSEITDRTAVMYAGNLVELAPTDELFSNPLHPYTKGLLACLPGKNKRDKELPTIPGSVPPLTQLPKGCNFYPRCPQSQDICKRETPELIRINNEHYVACFQLTNNNRNGGEEDATT